MFQINKMAIFKNIAIITSSVVITSCNSGSSSSTRSANATLTAVGQNMTIIQSNAATNNTFETKYSSGTLDSLLGVECINGMFVTTGSTIIANT